MILDIVYSIKRICVLAIQTQTSESGST